MPTIWEYVYSGKGKIPMFWWVAIEGIRQRFGHYQPSWNPADTGVNQYINQLLCGLPPTIGGQEADPLNGSCRIPSHSFVLSDQDGVITELLAVSDTPFANTWLTGPVDAEVTNIPIEDDTDFNPSGDIFLDRETIHYASIASDSRTGLTAGDGLTGQTADGGTVSSLSDVHRTEADGYWTGAQLEVTAGANAGEIRVVSNYYFDEEDSRGIFLWDSPMPVACDATTVFKITMPADHILCTALTEVAGYWNGAIVEITMGPYMGEVRWVKESVTGVLTLVTPLPGYVDSYTDFNIILTTLHDCTRGMYGSIAKAHLVTDASGASIFRRVSDKPPFIKTRKVWIYQAEEGQAEADAERVTGFVEDYNLSSDGCSYQFSVEGFMRVLARTCMSKQKRATLDFPLWGGSFELVTRNLTPDVNGAHRWRNYQTKYAFMMADGRVTGFSVNKIYFKSIDPWANKGNIKIDDEIIHYRKKGWGLSANGDELRRAMFLSDFEVNLQADWDGNPCGDMVMDDTEAAGKAGYENRGLFGEKIGLVNVTRDRLLNPLEKEREAVGSSYNPQESLPVRALMAEHDTGAEIEECCVCCDDGEISDFPRHDLVGFTMLAGSMGQGDELLDEGTNCVSTIMKAKMTGASEGYYLVAFSDSPENGYVVGNTISHGASTAIVTSYRREVRPRNNAVDVLLQLLMSSGTRAQNGAYDTLPAGWGLGLTEDEIDVASFESLRDSWFAGLTVDFILHESTSGDEFIKDHFLRPMQAFPYENTDGKIALACLMTRAEATTVSGVVELDDDHMKAKVLPNWTSGKPPITKAIVKYNKLPGGDDYKSQVNLIFGNANDWYENIGRTVEISIATLYYPDSDLKRLDHRDTKLPAIIRRMTGVLWDRQGCYPCPVISAETPISDRTVNIGDIVLVSHEQLPNLRTSLRGLTDEYYQVIGRTQSPKTSSMKWILWQIGVHDALYGRRAPSGQILSYAADTPETDQSTIVLHESVYSPPGTKDAASFRIADVVMFLHADYTPIGEIPETAAIHSVSGNTIVLVKNLDYPPSDGDLLEFACYDSAVALQKAQRVYMADDKRLLGSGDSSAFKYM